MILFALGMVAGAILTVAVASILAARDADERITNFKTKTHYEGNR